MRPPTPAGWAHEPRVALLSHSTFGQPMHATVHGIREAVAILDARGVDFEFDGDMSPDVALEPQCARSIRSAG